MEALSIAFFATLFLRSYADLVGVAIVPHGDFAVAPEMAKFPDAYKLKYQTQRVGTWLAQEVRPDAILFSTPHGIALDRDVGLYGGATSAAGVAEIGLDLIEAGQRNVTTRNIKVGDVTLDTKLVDALLANISNRNMTKINWPNKMQEPFPLRWAEVVPLTLLRQGGLSVAQGMAFMSQPSRRQDYGSQDFSQFTDEMYSLGQIIADQVLIPAKRRIAVVISADFAHTHGGSALYPYSPAAQPFDEAIKKWFENPLKYKELLLQSAKSLAAGAKSCGYTSLVLLQGMLCAHKLRTGSDWVPVISIGPMHGGFMFYGSGVAALAPSRKQQHMVV